MKRITALIFLVTLCASALAGCGDSEGYTSGGTGSLAGNEQNSEDENNSEAGFRIPGIEDTEELTEKSAEIPEAFGSSFRRGTVEDGVYRNEFSGIQFNTPEGWSIMSESQLLSMVNTGLEITGNEELLDEELMDQSVIYDYAARTSEGGSIAVVFENLAVSTGKKSMKYLSAEEYLNALSKDLKTVSGVEYKENGSMKEVSLGGQSFMRKSFTAKYTTLGYTINQYYYAKNIDGLMLYIIISSGADQEDMTVYEKDFSALD